MSSNSYVNLKIATCLVRYADDRLIDQRFPSFTFLRVQRGRPMSSDAFGKKSSYKCAIEADAAIHAAAQDR
ncbi:hypothetical protein [Burkholderia cenocepacia]|uniref:hypothetical protein n=1 Tax=Burkholderia cenocepacia TaxID=95486 RepID=UPI00117772C0|nr:hypothetical protein [Burkholderia cenocepacia]